MDLSVLFIWGWVPLSIFAYFLNGLASTLDKILLTHRVPNSVTYTFYSGILSIGVLILIPLKYFNFISTPGSFQILSPNLMFWAFLSGGSFLAALYFFYSALHRCDASRIVPIVGGLSPIFILFFSWLINGEQLTQVVLLAILFFVLGGIFLSADIHPESKKAVIKMDGVADACLAGVLFAVNLYISKLVLLRTDFISGFVWMRLGSFIFAVFMLYIPYFKKHIHSTSKKMSAVSGIFIFVNKLIGALALILIYYAISLTGNNFGHTAVINSLQGIQYLFVFLLSIIFSLFFPKVLKETLNRHVLVLKFVGILSITLGFIYLVQV